MVLFLYSVIISDKNNKTFKQFNLKTTLGFAYAIYILVRLDYLFIENNFNNKRKLWVLNGDHLVIILAENKLLQRFNQKITFGYCIVIYTRLVIYKNNYNNKKPRVLNGAL